MKEKMQTILLGSLIIAIFIVTLFSLLYGFLSLEGDRPLVNKEYYIIKSVTKNRPDKKEKYEYLFENSNIKLESKEKFQVGDTLVITKK